MKKLSNGRVTIALHTLREGDGLSLLLLHELGSHGCAWEKSAVLWPGPVHALDFAGHGRSDRLVGGGYYPELFAADADLALEALGDTAAVVGAGVGGYVAALLAGGRPEQVRAALLLPGRGLAGWASAPDPTKPAVGLAERQRLQDEAASAYAAGTDPMVSGCEMDLRPADYASEIASAARCLLFCETVSPDEAPRDGLGWWRAAFETSGRHSAPSDLGLALGELEGRCR